MMETIIEQILPIFLIILIGYCAGRWRVLPEETGSTLCNFLFYFCLPPLVFSNIVNSNIQEIFNWRYALCFLLSAICIASLEYLIYTQFLHITRQKLVLMTMGGLYGNLGYVGIPLFISLFGSVGPLPIGLMLQAIFILPTILYLLDKNNDSQKIFSLRNCVLLIVRNPVILFSLLACLVLYFRIQVPAICETVITQMGTPASVTGLFALGFTCNYGGKANLKLREIKLSLVVVISKLLIYPLFTWLIGRYIFRMNGWWLNTAVITSMLPTAVNHFIISQRFHTDIDISRVIILLSTFFFAITISIYTIYIGL